MGKKIAITGGIGSGKSTVSNILKEKGYPVYSCDEIYAELIHSEDYICAIKKAFPSVVKEGKIDKKLLSDIIFSNAQARTRLNEIAHPLIMKRLFERMNETDGEIVFAEVPLLFEGDFENLFERTIVVMRNVNERVRAVCMRDGISAQKAKERINAQFDYDNPKNAERYQKCGAIFLENEGGIQSLKKSVEQLLKNLS